MKYWKSISTIILGLVLLSSCGSESEHTKLIPEDANLVVTVNVGSIKSKNTDLESVLKYLEGDIDEQMQKVLNSGINLSDKVYIFSNMDTENQPYFGGVALLDDAAKFEETVKAEMDDAEISEEEGLKIAVKGDEIIAWNEKTVAFANANGKEESIKLAKRILSGGESSLLASSDNFKESIKKDADISYWMNVGNIKDDAEKIDLQFSMINEEIDLSDTYVNGAVNFENGEVNAESNFYGTESSTKLIGAIFGKKVDGALMKAAAGEGLLGAMAIGINLEGLINALKEKHGDDVKNALSQAQMDEASITDILSGDMVGTFNGMIIEEGPYGPRPRGANFSVLIGIKSKEKCEEMLKKLGLEPENGLYSIPMVPGVSAKITDKYIIATGMEEEFASKAMNGEAGSLSENDQFKNEIVSFFMDFDAMPKELKDELKRGNPLVEELTSTNITVKQDGNVTTSTVVIKLKNTDKNSFSVIAKKLSDEDEMM